MPLFAAGCTGPEQKLGRGLDNTFEIVRWGELRRSVEQNAVDRRARHAAILRLHPRL